MEVLVWDCVFGLGAYTKRSGYEEKNVLAVCLHKYMCIHITDVLSMWQHPTSFSFSECFPLRDSVCIVNFVLLLPSLHGTVETRPHWTYDDVIALPYLKYEAETAHIWLFSAGSLRLQRTLQKRTRWFSSSTYYQSSAASRKSRGEESSYLCAAWLCLYAVYNSSRRLFL